MTCLSRATVLLGVSAAMASTTFCPGPRSDAFTFTPKVMPKGWKLLDVFLIFFYILVGRSRNLGNEVYQRKPICF